jgi:hypothetical protein
VKIGSSVSRECDVPSAIFLIGEVNENFAMVASPLATQTASACAENSQIFSELRRAVPGEEGERS